MARTYKRDSRGRFASTGGSSGGGRPAAKPVSRGTNRLTRDNAGRITSVGGNGATARGGRLRTAAGNLRARQIDRVNAAPKGVVSRSGAARAKVNVQQGRATAATSRLRPGELMNANARPVATVARPQASRSGFKKTKRENLAVAEAMVKRAGLKSYVDTRRNAQGVASTSPFRPDTVKLVKNSEYWSNPKRHSREQRRQGWWASSDPAAVVYHEIGHTRAKRSGFMNDSSKAWGIGQRPFSSSRNQALARRVSGYAASAPGEFVAETYAGLRTGRRYDYQVMRAYREEAGFSARPAARRRSRRR